MGRPTLTIVVPAFNEARRLPLLLQALAAEGTAAVDAAGLEFVELVVVDDGSTDETPAILAGTHNLAEVTKVITLPANCGKGAAVRAGALVARGEWILMTDVDLSTPLSEVVSLSEALERGADLAIGSRSIEGSDVARPQPRHRELMGKTFNLLLRLSTGIQWRDTQCGFKLFRTGTTRPLFELQRVRGFAFDAELCVNARRLGLVVVEIPVRWYDNRDTRVHLVGSSTQMLLDLARIAWNAHRPLNRHRRPMTFKPTVAKVQASTRSLPATLAAALRPRQWLKNLLLLAGLVFAAELDDATRWPKALAACAIYCAASSASYLVNDVRDAEVDRRHPRKRFRPVASGELEPRHAVVAAGLLAVVAFAGAAVLGAGSVLLLALFALLQLAYSAVLKHIVLVDVLTISALFVVRAGAGAEAIDVRISAWLLVCTALLSLFLALNKRRGELADDGCGHDRESRRVLRRYDLRLVDTLVLVTGLVTVSVYTAYTLTGTRPALFPLTILPVAFGLGRYLFLVRRRDAGEEPEKVLVGDMPILVATLAWAVLAGALLAT